MEFTRLKNGNVIYNGKETEIKELPRPFLIDLFADETGITKNKLSSDNIQALELFFGYAERNGYTFPAIPPKELFLRYEAENTYYKYGDLFQYPVTKKRGERAEDNAILKMFHDFVMDHKLMTEREWERNESYWRETLQNETVTETVYERKPIEEHGKKVIDWSQQTRQNENNNLIRNFYKWLSKYAK